MKTDLLDVFNSTFVNYYENKVPMWANWNYKEDELQIKIAIPGFEKEDFDLSVSSGELFLKVKDEEAERERSYSVITKNWNTEYNLEKAKAKYKNGMLIISIPKEVKAKALKSIEIS